MSACVINGVSPIRCIMHMLIFCKLCESIALYIVFCGVYAVKAMRRASAEHFGFHHARFVYSGRRGVVRCGLTCVIVVCYLLQHRRSFVVFSALVCYLNVLHCALSEHTLFPMFWSQRFSTVPFCSKHVFAANHLVFFSCRYPLLGSRREGPQAER